MSATATAQENEKVAIAPAGTKQASALNFVASSIICWSILIGAFIVDQMLPPENSGTVIAVFPPSLTEAEISVAVTTAQGETMAPTRYSRAVVVESTAPGFVERLEDAGAVTVITPVGPLGAFLLGNRAADFD